ncbi:hypothetical protein [Vibrio superstes]|uniref:DUF481 domain-containing protein n=1 Tax=Vibrio superstes NBRC 103154 TaxID=1219062 RepID=A0A511QSL2_9VIBR|nr:hypothetical protein [Vibrio superstes]GEM80345.1 hypothetical protein VSU01S_25900 [Vibrio superstes NBRC 103154]
MFRFLFVSILLISHSSYAVGLNDFGWFHSVALRSHVDLESETQEVSGSLKLTPVDKLSAAYQTQAGGNYYLEYARGFKLSQQFYLTADIGFFKLVEEESIGYLGAQFSYVPSREWVLSVDFTETESLGDYSISEHRYIAASALWRPTFKTELLIQTTRVQPKGVMQEVVGNYNEYEAYAAYQCTTTIKPYIYTIKKETSKDMNVNLGVEFNFN